MNSYTPNLEVEFGMARVVIEIWRRHYNHERHHSSLKDLTPIQFKTRYDSINPGAIVK